MKSKILSPRILIDQNKRIVFYSKKIDIVVWLLKWPFVTVLAILYFFILLAGSIYNGFAGFINNFKYSLVDCEVFLLLYKPFVFLWQVITFKKEKWEKESK